MSLLSFSLYTGVLLITEYSQVQYMGNTRYDSPPLRFAKSMTSLGVALAVAALFQASDKVFETFSDNLLDL